MRLLPFVLALVWAASAEAQVGYLWTPDELVAHSDAVLICEHVSTQPTGLRTPHPSLQPALPVVEVVSTLHVLAVLKGPSDEQVRLRHYWIDREQLHGQGLVNTGGELRFGTRRATYLVFLKRDQTGAYTPTSGFTFPTTSVQRLVDSGTDPTR